MPGEEKINQIKKPSVVKKIADNIWASRKFNKEGFSELKGKKRRKFFEKIL